MFAPIAALLLGGVDLFLSFLLIGRPATWSVHAPTAALAVVNKTPLVNHGNAFLTSGFQATTDYMWPRVCTVIIAAVVIVFPASQMILRLSTVAATTAVVVALTSALGSPNRSAMSMVMGAGNAVLGLLMSLSKTVPVPRMGLLYTVCALFIGAMMSQGPTSTRRDRKKHPTSGVPAWAVFIAAHALALWGLVSPTPLIIGGLLLIILFHSFVVEGAGVYQELRVVEFCQEMDEINGLVRRQNSMCNVAGRLYGSHLGAGLFVEDEAGVARDVSDITRLPRTWEPGFLVEVLAILNKVPPA